jgi:signal transduction histidine kinase
MSLSDDVEFQRELEAAKLRALVEFAAGAGHEINNPVATIVGYVQQLLATENDPERRRMLTTIGGQAYRIRDMIGDVMLFGRPPQPHPEVVEFGAVCRELVAKFEPDAQAIGCAIRIEQAAAAWGLADPVQVRVALGAILRNSLEAVDSQGKIEWSITSAQEQGTSWVVLTLRDNGRGLSGTDSEHLFDPFYSGRQAGRGLGFGLAKAWRIITLHGGRIEVAAPAEQGVTLCVHWPAAAPPGS